jgi:hypothetical protein
MRAASRVIYCRAVSDLIQWVIVDAHHATMSDGCVFMGAMPYKLLLSCVLRSGGHSRLANMDAELGGSKSCQARG